MVVVFVVAVRPWWWWWSRWLCDSKGVYRCIIRLSTCKLYKVLLFWKEDGGPRRGNLASASTVVGSKEWSLQKRETSLLYKVRILSYEEKAALHYSQQPTSQPFFFVQKERDKIYLLKAKSNRDRSNIASLKSYVNNLSPILCIIF